MKVAIDGRVFSTDQLGGDASVGVQLASEVARHHRVKIFSHAELNSWPNRKLEHTPIEKTADYFSNMVYGLCWEQMFLPNAIDQWEPDILFCPNSYCPIVKTDAKKVIAIQDLPSYHSFGNRKYRLFRKLILPMMVKRADRIVTVSEFTRQEIINRLNVQPSKVGVVYNGIDPVYFNDGIQPEEQLPDNYILFVGAKSERKNVQGVIESYKILKEEYNTSQKLVLVGPDQNPTYDLVNESETHQDIKGDIINTGYLTEEELSYVYSMANVFVFPSYHESFGLPPVEAMASGTPVVTSQCGAIPEIVGDAAEFTDPASPQEIADSIRGVISDDSRRKELIQKGKDISREYSWKQSARQLMSEFDKA